MVKESEVTTHRPILRRDISLKPQGPNESIKPYLKRVVEETLDQLPDSCPIKESIIITNTGNNIEETRFSFRSLPRSMQPNAEYLGFPATIDFTEKQIFDFGADHNRKDLYASHFLTTIYFAPFPSYNLNQTLTLVYENQTEERSSVERRLLGYLVTNWI